MLKRLAKCLDKKKHKWNKQLFPWINWANSIDG